MAASLPGSDDIVRVELSNGIVVLARLNDCSPSVNIGGMLQVGALRDPQDKLGLAEFCASMLLRGTRRRSFQQLYGDLESVGASFSYKSGVHTTVFGGKALAEHARLLCELLAETLTCPAFPKEYIERLRGQLLTQLAILAQDPEAMAARTLDKILYKNHPYSRPPEGYPHTINAIRRKDLEEFHSRYYSPRGMVIAVAGALDPWQAVDLIADTLGTWNPATLIEPLELPPITPLEKSEMEMVAMEEKSQTAVYIGVVGPARRDPHFLPAYVGNSILGQFGMYGRIGEVIREQEGLAYYAYSTLSGGVGPGPWLVEMGVAPEKVEKAIQLIVNEIHRFTEYPVSEQELEDNQSMFIGALPLSMESNESMVASLLNIEKYQLGLDYYRQFPDLIRQITPQQILEAARCYWQPEKIGIAVAGSLASFGE